MDNLTLTALKEFNENTAPGTLIPCVVKLSTSATHTRVPIHLTLLIDVSESMQDENRLKNVKECCKILLNFLSETDYLTLITFGSSAKTVTQGMSVSSVNRRHLEEIISSLDVDGCTNLSAGLAEVRFCLDTVNDIAKACKQGLLILTDGHANRGLHKEDEIRQIFKNLSDRYSTLSIHSIGYGANHNAGLLRSLAESACGSYNVVNEIEDTAVAFGNTVGGLMTCCIQSAVLNVPESAKLHGPLINKEGSITLGDLYSGVNQIYLLDIPVESLRVNMESPCVSLQGVSMPSLDRIIKSATFNISTQKDPEVVLTRLRYECSELLKLLSSRNTARPLAEVLRSRVEKFEKGLDDDDLKSHSLHSYLKSEIPVLKELLNQIIYYGYTDLHTTTTAQQHSAFMGLGRGFSTPRAPRHSSTSQNEPPEDPSTTTLFQNSVQAGMSALMASATQNPHSDDDEENAS